jgi:hypothetical protein
MSGPDHIDGPVWQREKRNVVVIAGKREYQGKVFFDIREWVKDGDNLTATKKGLTIPLDAIESLGLALASWPETSRQTGK